MVPIDARSALILGVHYQGMGCDLGTKAVVQQVGQ
jgi:hypothetical protein